MTKKVNDKQKIEQVLTMVEGLNVKETQSEGTFEKMKSSDTYMFVFSEGENQYGKAPFAFYVLDNGTFIFPYKDFNSPKENLITIEKHDGLLKEIKNLFNISY
ncbi:hypothetical protein [Pontibacillus yanchengensis]|uniref:Uncharacterized protein n=1 Tax=Pontibacillus yanchengensis Y32 TaxID=1385514 RepID=A0A0A2TT02_9BACI|nr:hypothetical protein [Pontibacillus yanchengensis]KGP72360.1 hypothetical protein N782_13000 [Pontibacillus yanchengensis Y32]